MKVQRIETVERGICLHTLRLISLSSTIRTWSLWLLSKKLWRSATGVMTSIVGISSLAAIDETFVKSAATTDSVTGLALLFVSGVGVGVPLVSKVHFKASNILRGQNLGQWQVSRWV